MTIQEVKSKIEENAPLIGNFITGSIDMSEGTYTRYWCEYTINLSPEYLTTFRFIAHGDDGVYTLDKNYEYNIDELRRSDMETDSRDYLEAKVVSKDIYTWDDITLGNENPDISYAKVYTGTSGSVVPHAWVLVREEDGLTHAETSFDQFPISEEL